MPTLKRIFVVGTFVVALVSMEAFLGRGTRWGERRAHAQDGGGIEPQQDVFTALTGTLPGTDRIRVITGLRLIVDSGSMPITQTPGVNVFTTFNGAPTAWSFFGEVKNGNQGALSRNTFILADPRADVHFSVTGTPTASTHIFAFESLLIRSLDELTHKVFGGDVTLLNVGCASLPCTEPSSAGPGQRQLTTNVHVTCTTSAPSTLIPRVTLTTELGGATTPEPHFMQTFDFGTRSHTEFDTNALSDPRTNLVLSVTGVPGTSCDAVFTGVTGPADTVAEIDFAGGAARGGFFFPFR